MHKYGVHVRDRTEAGISSSMNREESDEWMKEFV